MYIVGIFCSAFGTVLADVIHDIRMRIPDDIGLELGIYV